MSVINTFFSRPALVFGAAIIFRLALLEYGRWQDAHSPVKYTDIDYLVFTDAARFVAQGRSPYDRATYRYTPLLAWLLYPTSWGAAWFEFGKLLFATGDIVTGWLISRILASRGMHVADRMKYASIWLLNPMVANISTRGSSEGLVVVIVVALLWAVLERRHVLAGILLGLGVHVKIYPFIYAASIFWWLGSDNANRGTRGNNGRKQVKHENLLFDVFNRGRLRVIIAGALTTLINLVMFAAYGMPFLEHTYLYHFTRIDHRHNFSIYNTALHLNSAQGTGKLGFAAERIAFIPQLFLSVLAIPYVLSKRDLAGTMLAQTFAFVTFNKVCTSQYFLWYMVFLPLYLPSSSLLRKPWLGTSVLLLWVVGQAFWLQQGYELEFLGRASFYPGLWTASLFFFGVNCWILGIIVSDIRTARDVVDSPRGMTIKP